MNAAQWERERRRLKGAVTRAKNAAGDAPTLAEKIRLRQRANECAELYRQHCLRYHSSVG